jgi:hypothetical protein
MLEAILSLLAWLTCLVLFIMIAIGFLFALAAGVMLLIKATTQPTFWIAVVGFLIAAVAISVLFIIAYILYKNYKSTKH